MSSSYTKVDLSVIKSRLKEGVYKSLSGANRAIGKAQDLSLDEKEKAKRLALKHFGAEASSTKEPTKKAAKKAPAKADAPKRGRGRPRKDASAAAPAAPKKRGRRAKDAGDDLAPVAAVHERELAVGAEVQQHQMAHLSGELGHYANGIEHLAKALDALGAGGLNAEEKRLHASCKQLALSNTQKVLAAHGEQLDKVFPVASAAEEPKAQAKDTAEAPKAVTPKRGAGRPRAQSAPSEQAAASDATPKEGEGTATAEASKEESGAEKANEPAESPVPAQTNGAARPRSSIRI